MAHIPHLDQLALIAVLGALVSVLLARLRLPTVAGLLFVGAIAGPHGFGLVGDDEAIRVLAEIGVVFLLFSIGLEFPLSRLRVIFRRVALGGALQVGLTIAVTAAVAVALGASLGRAILYGFVFSLSSTAIVLRALGERRELDAPHGRFIVGALVFQDLCVVPMVLVIPLLGGDGHAGARWRAIAFALFQAAALVIAVIVLARNVVPRVMRWVDASRSREVFLLAVLGICIGTAWLTSLAGLSLALGAFLAGIVVAGTEFGHRALGDVLPLRDAFVSVFFVSLGMLFDGSAIVAEPVMAALVFAGFVLGKGALATLAAMFMRFPARAAWLAGVGLAQFGELGFVLATTGHEAGISSTQQMSVVLSTGIATMFLTPLLVRVAPHVTAGERVLAPLERLLGAEAIDQTEPRDRFADHVVVVGFGIAGRLVCDALAKSDVPHVVLELNAETVRAARAAGEPVFYGDATSVEALEHAGLPRAIALVIVMNDPRAAVRVVDAARRIAPDVPSLVRAHYLGEGAELVALGASEVVADEVEAAMELVARVLRRLEVPRNVIDERLDQARATVLAAPERRRSIPPPPRLGQSSELAELTIERIAVRSGSRAVGRTPIDLDLRRRTGALVVAIRRGATLEDPPRLEVPLAARDIVFVVGTTRAVEDATRYLDTPADRISDAPPSR